MLFKEKMVFCGNGMSRIGPTWNVKVEKFIFLMPDGFPIKLFIPGWETVILSTYRGFENHGGEVPFEFQTLVWVENATQDVYCEWIPICEEGTEG